jgi:nucleoside-diphosphate-sugar epimerase
MILVTGGTGFIGSHLVERLLALGAPVRVLTRGPGPPDKARVEVMRGDLVSGVGVARSLSGVDTVLHLAGVTKALASSDYYAGNVQASENLARAVASVIAEEKRSIRMVHVSSLAAIGPGLDATPLMEDALPHPITPYGKSKLEAERVVRRLLPDAVIVRPPVVYGPRDTDVFQMLKSISRGIVLQMTGGERWFSAIYAKDLANGLIAAARAPGAAGRTYFMAHPDAVSWSELGSVAGRIMGREPRVVRISTGVANAAGYCGEMLSRLMRRPGIVSRDKVREAGCAYWVCDTRRAKAELGFEAATNIHDGLANTLAWYREAGWLKWG